MKRFLMYALLSAFLLEASAQNKILIITGGHNFEEKEFYNMFDSFANMEYDTISQPSANELLLTDEAAQYNCLVFYDMYNIITENQKSAYLKLLDNGMGMVFLHHSLVSYQDWPLFEKIIGGKYHRKASRGQGASTYQHDVDFIIEVVDSNHPITNGMTEFNIHDEVYGGFSVASHVHPLLKTNHPQSSSTIGWYHIYRNSRIVYIQPGHDHHAYNNHNYRRIVQNAIDWVQMKN